MSEDHGSWLSTAIAMFLPWSTLTFGVRAWAKIRTKNWGQDDYCISFALVGSSTTAYSDPEDNNFA